METSEQAEVRILKEENKALRAGISLMHRRAQRNEGAVRQLALARRGHANAIAQERERVARYEAMGLAAANRFESELEKAYAESWVSRLMRAIGIGA